MSSGLYEDESPKGYMILDSFGCSRNDIELDPQNGFLLFMNFAKTLYSNRQEPVDQLNFQDFFGLWKVAYKKGTLRLPRLVLDNKDRYLQQKDAHNCGTAVCAHMAYFETKSQHNTTKTHHEAISLLKPSLSCFLHQHA